MPYEPMYTLCHFAAANDRGWFFGDEIDHGYMDDPDYEEDCYDW